MTTKPLKLGVAYLVLLATFFYLLYAWLRLVLDLGASELTPFQVEVLRTLGACLLVSAAAGAVWWSLATVWQHREERKWKERER